MILGFDIGNTNTVLGMYHDSDVMPQHSYRYRTLRNITIDELSLMVLSFLDIFEREGKGSQRVTGVVFSSVVPEINHLYYSMSRRLFEISPFEIDHNARLSIKINYTAPEQLGSDRIVNAEAAFREYGGDCIIIDLGTATTFCVLLGSGELDGGLIGPGVGISMNALSERTSKLLKVDFKKPENVIARNTAEAITSGFFYGWLSMVEGIIKRIESYYNKTFLKIFTGGYAEIVGSHVEYENVIDINLTMKGLKYIFDQNV
jgi:type III pantothenate kinase